jgi:hypothetical protein
MCAKAVMKDIFDNRDMEKALVDWHVKMSRKAVDFEGLWKTLLVDIQSKLKEQCVKASEEFSSYRRPYTGYNSANTFKLSPCTCPLFTTEKSWNRRGYDVKKDEVPRNIIVMFRGRGGAVNEENPYRAKKMEVFSYDQVVQQDSRRRNRMNAQLDIMVRQITNAFVIYRTIFVIDDPAKMLHQVCDEYLGDDTSAGNNIEDKIKKCCAIARERIKSRVLENVPISKRLKKAAAASAQTKKKEEEKEEVVDDQVVLHMTCAFGITDKKKPDEVSTTAVSIIDEIMAKFRENHDPLGIYM